MSARTQPISSWNAADPEKLAPLIARLIEAEHGLRKAVISDAPRTSTQANNQPCPIIQAREALLDGRTLLQQAAELQTAILDAIPAHVALLDTQGKILTVNRSWRAFADQNSFHGLNFGVGQNYVEICDRVQGDCAEIARLTARGIRAVLTGQSPEFTHEYDCHSEEEHRWFRVIVSPLHPEQGAGAMVMHTQVTQQKIAEETIRRDAGVLAQLDDGIVGCDIHSRVVYWNEGAERLFGWTKEEMTGRHIEERFPPEMHATIRAFMEQIFTTGVTPSEWEDYRKDGSRIWVFWRSRRLVDAEGQVTGMIAVATDVSAKRKAEQRLREQAELLDHASDAIIVRDLDNTVRFWSKGAEQVYGWTAEEAAGQNLTDRLVKNPFQHREATELLKLNSEWTGELMHTRKDGREIICQCRWTLLHDDQGRPEAILSINTDITEQKQLETQFLRAQRMESVGTLASGIAHDLNNVLAPILMAVTLLKERRTDEEELQLLDNLERNAQRGADIIRQVLTFGRGVQGERVSVSLLNLLHEIERIVAETFPKNLELKTDADSKLSAVIGDSTQLHQALLNLCLNARDAMPQGGRLTLTARNIVLAEPQTSMHPGVKPGPFVIIEVADTGTGIPPEVRDKIFEPFFTTKTMGRGTGLGLSTTLAIIKSHGGFVTVNSEPDCGSNFKVHLPANATAPIEAEPEKIAPLARGHGQTILLVDDEQPILNITRQTLECYGYKTLIANDGATAVALYTQHQNEIAVVLTDMTMPVMDGAATIQALRKINPGVKIIAASGLGADNAAFKSSMTGIRHFLAKPYTAETMLNALQQLLGDQPA